MFWLLISKFFTELNLLKVSMFRMALVCFILLCVLYLDRFQSIKANTVKQVSHDNLITDELSLSPVVGQTLSGEIKGGQTRTYQISLLKGQYFYAEFHSKDFEATLRFQHSTGENISVITAPYSSKIPVAILAQTSGTYRLAIESNNKNEIGHYELFITDVRLAHSENKTRLRAVEHILQGTLAIHKWTHNSFQTAIKSYMNAINIWRSISDKGGEGSTQIRLGNVYLLINDTVRAIQSFNAALLASKKSKSTYQEIESYNGLCASYILIGDNQKGKPFCEQGLQLSKSISYRTGEAQSLYELGNLQWAYSNMPRAKDFYQKSLAIWREERNHRAESDTLLNLSYVEFEQGNTSQAFAMSENVLRLSRLAKDIRLEAYTLTAIGNFCNRSGDNQRALNFYAQALPLFRRMQDLNGEADIMSSTASVYRKIGNEAQAFSNYNQSLHFYQKLSRPYNEAIVRTSIATILIKRKDYARALTNLNKALEITKIIDDPLLESLVLKTLGAASKELGRIQQALENYKLALERKPSETDIFNEANMLSEIGDIYQILGKEYFDEAQDSFQKSLALSRKIKDISSESLTLYRFARLERERGNLDKAKEYIEASLELSDTLRSQFTNQDFRSLYFASAHDLHELYIDVLMSLDKERPNTGFANAAFEASERGRARTLLEMLAESRIVIRADADASLLAQEQKLQKRLREQTEKQIKLLSGKHTAEEAGALTKEIESTLAEYKELQNRIRLSSPRYASLTQPRPLSLKEIQEQLLDDETQLLEFSLGEERSFLWVVSKNGVESFELPKGKVIEESVKKILGLLIEESEQTRALRSGKESITAVSSQSKFETESLRLSRMLFGQAQSSLKAKRLLIVSNGVLQNLPFGALPIESPKSEVQSPKSENGWQFLISKYEIINLPSASTLAALRQEERENRKHINSVAIFADPVFSKDDERLLPNSVASNKKKNQPKISRSNSSTLRALYEIARASYNKTTVQRSGLLEIPRLPFSRGEADAVASMLPSENVFLALGFKADLNAATNPKLADYNVIHFATHGFLNNEQPELSGVMFSRFNERGEAQNGFLSLQEIYNLRLPVELVVLSACETGLGKELKGEGILGLTRGFMYAGAKRVIASLWKVDDVATAELMKLFYQKLLKENLSPTAALRVAQIEMQKQKRWKSPYYWAAFQIQGEWK